jgi:Domain of unknown function (DUF305)
MAQVAFAESANPTIRDLAGQIVDDQTSEIEQMRGWFEDWYPGARRPPDPVVTKERRQDITYSRPTNAGGESNGAAVDTTALVKCIEACTACADARLGEEDVQMLAR